MDDDVEMPRLHVVTCSTREGRVGPAVASWFTTEARSHGGFHVHPVDLKEVALPLLDEPNHPNLRDYVHQHTKDWSASVDSADAFVFVVPEYNYGVSAPLLNALDYLFHEWAYKACGFVSYGGASGGMRGVQMAKLVTSTLKMVALPEAVNVHFVKKQLDPEDGRFLPEPDDVTRARALLDELLRWERGLSVIRREVRG